MECPRCVEAQDLIQVVYGGVEIDHCPACQGLWLDAGELTDLQAWFSPDDQFIQDTQQAGDLPRHDDALKSACPADGTQLKGCRLPETRDLSRPTLDICPHCLGIWVDGGERSDLHAILMSRRADDLETALEVYVPAPRWQYYLRFVVPDFIFRRFISDTKPRS